MFDETKVCAVLLVPAEGDPLGLLREGPCGARPPIAEHVAEDMHGKGCKRTREWFAPPQRTCCSMAGLSMLAPHRRALVLAWDGEVVPEGCFRASRLGTSEWISAVADGLKRGYVHGFVRYQSQKHGLGTVIWIDADGREVPCVR